MRVDCESIGYIQIWSKIYTWNSRFDRRRILCFSQTFCIPCYTRDLECVPVHCFDQRHFAKTVFNKLHCCHRLRFVQGLRRRHNPACLWSRQCTGIHSGSLSPCTLFSIDVVFTLAIPCELMLMLNLIARCRLLQLISFIWLIGPQKCGSDFKCAIFKCHLLNDTFIIPIEYCRQKNARGHDRWQVNICPDSGFVPSGHKPLPEPRLTNMSVAIWCH